MYARSRRASSMSRVRAFLTNGYPLYRINKIRKIYRYVARKRRATMIEEEGVADNGGWGESCRQLCLSGMGRGVG